MFPIFVLNVHNNIALIKPAELEFLFLAFIFFYGFLIIKNSSKLGFSEVFGHLLKKLWMPDHVTYVTGILWVLPDVCVWKLVHVGQIFEPFLALNSAKN